MRALDLTGKTFGNITVIKRVDCPPNRKLGIAYWLVQCACGNTKVLTSNTIVSGHTRSCGCRLNAKTTVIDRTGKVYGFLTVIQRSTTKVKGKRTGVYWVCICQCGNEITAHAHDLSSGHTVSCGCYHRRALVKFGIEGKPKYNPTLPPHVKNFLQRMSSYYGLTPQAWTQLVLESNGRCEVCLEQFINEPKRIHVDHDHKTNTVRGLLCHICNRWVGFIDKPEFLSKVLAYLKRHATVGESDPDKKLLKVPRHVTKSSKVF